MATVRDPQSKDTPAPAVTDNIVGENATHITDNRRRYHRQGQALVKRWMRREKITNTDIFHKMNRE